MRFVQSRGENIYSRFDAGIEGVEREGERGRDWEDSIFSFFFISLSLFQFPIPFFYICDSQDTLGPQGKSSRLPHPRVDRENVIRCALLPLLQISV